MGDQSKANAQNKAAINRYKNQMKINRFKDLNTFNVYNQRVSQFEQQVQQNNLAANRAYMNEMLKLDQLMKSQSFKNQDAKVLLQREMGKVAARGTAGQSALAAQQSLLAQSGRNEAIREETFRNAALFARVRNEDTAMRANFDNTRAFNEVAIAPTNTLNPAKPTLVDGPSPLSLVAGLGNAAVSGITAGFQASQW